MTHLILSAEDVGIILLEPPDSGEASQSSGQLVSMQNAEVCHPQW